MTKRVFSVSSADAKASRRRKFFLLGGIVLLILAVVITLLAVFIPRWMHSGTRECRKRSFGLDSFVCVCSEDYCDEIDEVGDVGPGEMVYYVTSRDQHRMKRYTTKIGQHVQADLDTIEVEVYLNNSVTYQTVMGFGGAFSDAVGIVLNSLQPKVKEDLLKDYFDKNTGIRYTIGRVPIASTDFSTRIYSYADIAGDFDMNSFSLAIEDLQYKIPNILAAQKLAGEQFRLYASPWSAPWWMKENGKMAGGGPMKGKVVGGDDSYYRAYAKYLRLFFDEYAKRNVNFWAMTIENEPHETRQNYWQAMQFTSENQRLFAYHLLSPELKKSVVTKNLKIIAIDGQRIRIGEDAKTIYSNAQESSVIDGLAVHWYSFTDYVAPLQAAHAANPSKFILGSETSCGDQANGEFRGPQLGNWTRGWMYGHDILNDMTNWVAGWVDWNLCLDLDGGPNWFKNTIDAAIIVNATSQEYYKQPLFYFIAHFSRFVPPGSVRISSQLYDAEGYQIPTVDGFFTKEKGLTEHIAFRTPDGHLAAIIINGDAARERLMRVRIGNKQWRFLMPADSIVTAILKK